MIFRLIYHGFALLGMASLVFGLFYARKLMNDHSLPPRQFVIKEVSKLGVNPETAWTVVALGPQFADHQLTEPVTFKRGNSIRGAIS